jgi:hypothetical protein
MLEIGPVPFYLVVFFGVPFSLVCPVFFGLSRFLWSVAKRKEQGVETGDVQALGDQIRTTKPGTVVTFTVRRDSKDLKIPVTIAWAPGQVNSPTTRPNAEQKRK